MHSVSDSRPSVHLSNTVGSKGIMTHEHGPGIASGLVCFAHSLDIWRVLLLPLCSCQIHLAVLLVWLPSLFLLAAWLWLLLQLSFECRYCISVCLWVIILCFQRISGIFLRQSWLLIGIPRILIISCRSCLAFLQSFNEFLRNSMSWPSLLFAFVQNISRNSRALVDACKKFSSMPDKNKRKEDQR